jgi:hypothetical protein
MLGISVMTQRIHHPTRYAVRSRVDVVFRDGFAFVPEIPGPNGNGGVCGQGQEHLIPHFKPSLVWLCSATSAA